MAEYIEREALSTVLNQELSNLRSIYGYGDYDAYVDGFRECVDRVENFLSAADVAPVVHGQWMNPKGGFWGVSQCSACGEWHPTTGNGPKYCPNCGAKMDGGNDDDR